MKLKKMTQKMTIQLAYPLMIAIALFSCKKDKDNQGIGFNSNSYIQGYGYSNDSTGSSTSSSSSNTQTNLTVTDIDGNTYRTVKIGTQTWMAENLKVTRYRNGSSITYVTGSWSSLTSGSWGYPNHSSANNATYGKLYNYYAAVDSRKVAPQGWHVPSLSDWTTLFNYLGGSSIAGGKMKETGTSHWLSPNTGATNSSGFTALPAGSDNSNFTLSASFWATQGNASIQYNGVDMIYWPSTGAGGISIRCVKD